MNYTNKSLKPSIPNVSWLLLWMLICFPLSGCGSDEAPVEVIPINEWLTISTETMEFTYEGGNKTRSITLGEGTDVSKIKCSFSNNGNDWCTAILNKKELLIQVEHSFQKRSRTTLLTLSDDNKKKCIIPITQNAGPDNEDQLIKVVSGEATSEETIGKDSEGKPLTLDMTWDGNKKTYFNSKFGEVSYPFYITYTLEKGHTLNKIIYTPRTDAGNKWGSFDEFTVEVSTYEHPDQYTEIGTFARGNGVHTAMSIKLSEGITNAKKVRFTIHKAYENRISCAEMEFVEYSKNKFNPATIFADAMCTKLKEGVNEKQIKQIPNDYLRNVGLALFNGNYDSSYRLATYRPYQHPKVMAASNKTFKYSLRDNPTGLYVNSGEKLIVCVDKIYNGGIVSLLIQDLNGGYNRYKTYMLQEGFNEITTEIGGLIYVLNHVNDHIPLLLDEADNATKKIVKEKSVTIHIPMGKVNGYFDISKHQEEDWTAILNGAKYQDIDVLGKYSHITWRVEDFKNYQTIITQTIDNCDKLVYIEQEFMGLVKYNRMFNNRMHFCIDYTTKSPNASDYRTVYNDGYYYAEPFCVPKQFPSRCWGPAHEVGHCNQTRPGLKWSGMTEVTNNIHSLLVLTSFGRPCKLLSSTPAPKDENGNPISNNPYKSFYEAAIALIVNGKRAHCLPNIQSITRELQLVPFWQLKLYMHDVLKNTDFYPDLYEYFRNHSSPSDKGANQGLNQLDFVRQVCNLTKLNFLDFFEKWGFLKPVNTTLNDYGSKKFVITQQQIDDLKTEINNKGYQLAPKNLHLITEDNLNY